MDDRSVIRDRFHHRHDRRRTGSLLKRQKDWQPPPPMPDEWDWIQLTSG